MATGGEFFQPPLPFDPEILQGYQSLMDPNEWNGDVSFPCEYSFQVLDVILIRAQCSFLLFFSPIPRGELDISIPTKYGNERTLQPECVHDNLTEFHLFSILAIRDFVRSQLRML